MAAQLFSVKVPRQPHRDVALSLQVKIHFYGYPLLIAFGEQRGDETQAGSGIGKDKSDPGATFDLTVTRPHRSGQHSRAKPTVNEFTEGILH